MRKVRSRNDVVWVPVSGETAARLRNLSDACHADPVSVAASLLHDVLKEDEEAHMPGATHTGTMTLN